MFQALKVLLIVTFYLSSAIKIFAQCDSVRIGVTVREEFNSQSFNRETIHYSQTGKVLSLTTYYQPYPGSDWRNVQIFMYTYDNNDSLINLYSGNSVGTLYGISSNMDRTYDIFGNKLTETVTRLYLGVTTLTVADTLTYDSLNRITTFRIYRNQPALDIKVNYLYNASGLNSSKIFQVRNGSSWIDSLRTDIYYDASLNKTNEYDLLFSGTSWDSTEIRYYHFNSNQLLDTLYNQKYFTGNFINDSMQIFAYGAMNKLTHHYFLYWDSSQWTYYLDSVSEVDSLGFTTLITNMRANYNPNLTWSPNSGAFHAETHDSLGNLLTYDEHFEDGASRNGSLTYMNGILTSENFVYYSHSGNPSYSSTQYYYAELFGDSAMCSLTPDTLSVEDCPGNTFLWTTGDTTSSIVINTAGNYQCTITRGNGWVVQTPPMNVTFSNVVPYIVNSGDTTLKFCIGQPIPTLSTPYQPGVNYQWYTANSIAISNGDSSSYRPTVMGSYFLIASNACGSDTSAVTQLMAIRPDIIGIGGLTAVCPGMCNGTISLQVIGLEPVTYVWSTGDTTSAINNLCAGSYSVLVEDSLGCQNSFFRNITTDSLTLITNVNHTTCQGCTDGEVFLEVNNNVYPISNIEITPAAGTIHGDTISDLPPGIYEICISDTVGCMVCAMDTILENPVGVFEVDGFSIKIYPSPVQSVLNIQFENISETKKEYEIVNVYGQVFMKGNFYTNLFKIDVNVLPDGIYLLKIGAAKESTIKFLKN